MNKKDQKSVAVILGSAYLKNTPESLRLEEININTKWGGQKIYRIISVDRPSYVIFRHGNPHSLLPNQVNYRAQAAALKTVNCGALLITSSVGVMDAQIPLFKPLILSDILMPENRLPDGSTCTMFPKPSENHGHLVLKEGLFSKALENQVRKFAGNLVFNNESKEIIFAYAGGPRGKTAAENRMWIKLGGNVNSMTTAPEVVLANELEIPTIAIVAGHKYSVPDMKNPTSDDDVTESLNQSRRGMEDLIMQFVEKIEPVEFANYIYRFD